MLLFYSLFSSYIYSRKYDTIQFEPHSLSNWFHFFLYVISLWKENLEYQKVLYFLKWYKNHIFWFNIIFSNKSFCLLEYECFFSSFPVKKDYVRAHVLEPMKFLEGSGNLFFMHFFGFSLVPDPQNEAKVSFFYSLRVFSNKRTFLLSKMVSLMYCSQI